mmetsp:Transcript_7196/g.28915  ORF Transcript_7196/g.28915 Transcript_7196/m.28915 type:complete len:217 (+) Transcript_7196:306-956(+)
MTEWPARVRRERWGIVPDGDVARDRGLSSVCECRRDRTARPPAPSAGGAVARGGARMLIPGPSAEPDDSSNVASANDAPRSTEADAALPRSDRGRLRPKPLAGRESPWSAPSLWRGRRTTSSTRKTLGGCTAPSRYSDACLHRSHTSRTARSASSESKKIFLSPPGQERRRAVPFARTSARPSATTRLSNARSTSRPVSSMHRMRLGRVSMPLPRT